MGYWFVNRIISKGNLIKIAPKFIKNLWLPCSKNICINYLFISNIMKLTKIVISTKNNYVKLYIWCYLDNLTIIKNPKSQKLLILTRNYLKF